MDTDKLLIELKNSNIQILRNQIFMLECLDIDINEKGEKGQLIQDTKAILLRLLDAD